MNKYICVFSFLFLGFSFLIPAQPQEGGDKGMSFDYMNIPLSDAIEELSNQVNINFSYNSDLLEGITIAGIKRKNISIDSALKVILSPFKLEYYISSNHILIYKKFIPGEAIETKKPVEEKKLKPETIVVRDTILIRDTIVKPEVYMVYDTIFVRDTVELIKDVPPEIIVKHDTVYKTKPEKDSYSKIQYKLNYSITQENLSKTGIAYNWCKSKNSWYAGLDLCLTDKNSSKEIVDSSKIYKKFIADKYFVVNNGDTSWVFVEDSVEITQINHHGKSISFSLLDFPLAYTHVLRHKQSLFHVGITAIPGIVIKSKGYYLTEDNTVKDAESNQGKFYLSAGALAMYEREIRKKLFLFTGVSYTYNLISYYPSGLYKPKKTDFNFFIGLSIKIPSSE